MEDNLNEENNLLNKMSAPIVGEAIEESIMIVKGEGSGNECDTGNPDETNTQNETSKNEDVKKPKLWSIEAICSSSKEVKEEIISVPKTGFFFGDDSVPSFNNVSNGENSHLKEKKLEVEPSKDKVDEVLQNIKYEEVDSTSTLNIIKPLNKECITKNEEEFSSKKSSKQSVFNIKVHEEEVQITERNANEVFNTSDSSINIKIHKMNVYETPSLNTFSKSQDFQLNSTTQVLRTNEKNPSLTSSEAISANTVDNVCQNEIVECKVNTVNEQICKNVKDNTSEKKPSQVNFDRQKGNEDNLYLKSKENRESDQQLTTKIVDQIIITDDDKKMNKQSTNEITKSEEKKKNDNSYAKVKTNESLTNIINQCVHINEQQSTQIIVQNLCALNESTQSKVLGIVTDNQILTNCNVIDNDEVIVNLVKDKEIDQNLSEDNSKDLKITDYSQITAISSKSELNQHNNDNSTLKYIIGGCNRGSSSSNKIQDQLETNNLVDQYFKISKQIDDNNYKKLKNTAHNISNIIETSVVDSDSIKTNEDNNSKHLDDFEINNENNFVNNVFQKENNLTLNKDCSTVSNKHSLDKILLKSDQVIETSKNDSTKELKLKDQPESSNIKIDSKCKVKSEINIKELKTEYLDISKNMITTKIDEQIEDNKNIVPDTTSTHEKHKTIIDTINKEPIDIHFEELSKTSTKQCEQIKQVSIDVSSIELKLNLEKIILNKSKKAKRKLMNVENKPDSCHEEKLHLRQLKNPSCTEEKVQNLSIHENSLARKASMVIDENNTDEILQNGKN